VSPLHRCVRGWGLRFIDAQNLQDTLGRTPTRLGNLGDQPLDALGVGSGNEEEQRSHASGVDELLHGLHPRPLILAFAK